MAGELILNEVATPPTPAATKDSIYMANVTLPRLQRVDSAGTIWPVADILVQSLASNFTMSNVATAQAAFNGTTNGAVTLPASSGYLIEGNYTITSTGTTSHTWAILFGGTATLTSGRITAIVTNAGTSSGLFAAQIAHTTTLGTAFVLTASSTSATENVNIMFYGTVRINAAGTLIPQVQASSAPGVAPTMLANSYIKLTPIGTSSAVSLGNWS